MSEDSHKNEDNYDVWGEEGLFEEPSHPKPSVSKTSNPDKTSSAPKAEQEKQVKTDHILVDEEKQGVLDDLEDIDDVEDPFQRLSKEMTEDAGDDSLAPEDDEEDHSDEAFLEYLFDEFHPRFPWLTGDLQTICNEVSQPAVDFYDYPEKIVKFQAEDGSGDTFVGVLQRPLRPKGKAGLKSRPLIVLVHGLGGHAQSLYLRRAAKQYLLRGFPVLRLNLRGAGISQSLCQKRYTANSYADLGAVLKQLPEAIRQYGVFLAGFSLGGVLVLRLLAEIGSGAYDIEDVQILGSACVSTPIDLKACATRLGKFRNRLYEKWLMKKLKEQIFACPSTTEKQKAIVQKCQSLYELDNWYSSRIAGYKNAEEYYEMCSTDYRLSEIKVPTMMICAQNDPWIPVKSYKMVEWSDLDLFLLMMPSNGGHCGFHDEIGDTWHDRSIVTWFEVCFIEHLDAQEENAREQNDLD